MSSFKSFAVAGIGSIGAPIAEELLKQKAVGSIIDDVVLFTRASSNIPTAACLTTLGARLVAWQPLLARAAKAAGVRLFVPSEYGAPTDMDATDVPGVLRTKRALQLELRELGMPYLLMFTGPCSDHVFVPELFIDLDKGSATVGGDGTALNPFTSMPDIARFVVHALVTLPPTELNWRTLRIMGARAASFLSLPTDWLTDQYGQSFNDIFKQYTARIGQPITVSCKSLHELQAAFRADPSDLASYLHWVWGQGKGVVGTPEELSHGLYPEWNPKKAMNAIIGS